jgi:hypothetical protein
MVSSPRAGEVNVIFPPAIWPIVPVSVSPLLSTTSSAAAVAAAPRASAAGTSSTRRRPRVAIRREPIIEFLSSQQ